jgi:hypothetical protein
MLEGRQLLSTVSASTCVPGPADIAPASTSTPEISLLGIANDSFLSQVLYSTPSRMASAIAPDGAVGVNANWENGLAPTWYIEQQRYGADFVQAGLVQGNAGLTQQGWNILDWGFGKEAANGSYPGTGDAFHSTSMFFEAAARALLLEVQSGSQDAPQLMAQYLPKIDATARWLMDPTVAAKGDAYDAPYTHRMWILAAGFGEAAALLHTQDTGPAATLYAQDAIACDQAAASYALKGLALQTSDGMNPELGGGEVTYQAYGILMAERYEAVCPDTQLCGQVQAMIVKGLNWEEQWIDSQGQVSTIGSTRTGELSRSGTPKTIDYKTIIQAFSVATTLTGDPSYRVVAEAVAAGRGWSFD